MPTDLDQTLALRPQFPEALTARGLVWTKKADFDRALADFDRSIELEPNTIESYHSRAGVYEKLGKVDLAMADLRKALTLVPKSIFDLAAQTDARKRVQQLEKNLPCGNIGAVNAQETCL